MLGRKLTFHKPKELSFDAAFGGDSWLMGSDTSTASRSSKRNSTVSVR